MKTTLLAIKRGVGTNTYDVKVQVGPMERVFRFIITPMNHRIDGVDLFVTSSDEFEKVFHHPEAYGTAYQLVGRFHQGKSLELPFYLGDFDVIL